MQGWQLQGIKEPLRLVESGDGKPSPGEAVVELRAAALNRRDYWITQGLYPGIALPVILGSDGAGVVADLGDDDEAGRLGDEVVIYPGIHWGSDPKAQSDDFSPLGMPTNGTLATRVLVPKECLFPKPTHLTWTEAAALPLGGTTAYRALCTQGELTPGERVLVTGVGGGVSSLALQLAVAMGGEVVVTSSSPEKLLAAKKLGAIMGFNYQQPDWHRQVRQHFGAFDLVLDSAGGAGINQYIDLLKSGGRIVSYGATLGRPEKLDLHKIFWKQIRLIGSSMGAPQEFSQYLTVVNSRSLKPKIDRVFGFDEVNEAMGRLASAEQMGKIVVDISPTWT